MYKIGFIGAGNMAGAIINGVISTNTYNAENLSVFDVNNKQLEKMEEIGVKSYNSIEDLVENNDIIFLSVKPQNFPEVLNCAKSNVKPEKMFVTIAAGISISYIQNMLECQCPVIRVMPNTPLLLGQGATAISRSQEVDDVKFELIRNFFASCGTVKVLDESLMNAVISVNGSSPAYIYLFVKAMVESAEKQGIDYNTALELSIQSLIGSAMMLKESNMTPDELIRMVSSPGGTTLAALDVFNKMNFEGIIDEAMKACTKRAEELGK